MLSIRGVSAMAGAALLAAVAGCQAPQRSEQGVLMIQIANAQGDAAAKADATPSKGTMTVGQRLEIRLGASAGTGYVWQMAGPAPAIMSLESKDPAGVVTPAAGADARTGGPTVTTYAMSAIMQGEATLRFVLTRPWEKDAAPARRVDIQVTVEPGPKPASTTAAK